ncbi:MAG: electron transfer flavoprotein subunit alpha/FixB family protein [Anaerolineales bacterium]
MSKNILVIAEHLQGRVLDSTYTMLAAARHLSTQTDGKVIAVMPGYKAQFLTQDFNADQVHSYDRPSLEHFSPDAYLKVLEAEIQEEQPRAVLFGHTTIGMDLAGVLSARLNLPLVSQVQRFEGLNFVSQICGGKIMAEGPLPEPTALITMAPGGYKREEGQGMTPPILEKQAPGPEKMRVSLLDFIEPDASDLDISRESVLVSVGRGLQNQADLELIERLARDLHGAVSASRPLVDKGWLPTSRLVGKSGKAVRPKLYLALGISGAPEHVEAVTGSDMIIAVNTDPNAPIFNIARYGAVMDMYALIEALSNALESQAHVA